MNHHNVQALLYARTILERRTANPGILWVQKESQERARDANVVGAGNLNVRNK